MLRFRGKTVLFLAGVLAAVLCLTVCALAADDGELETTWYPSDHLLKIECGAGYETMEKDDVLDGYEQELLDEIGSQIRTLWITGADLEDVNKGAMSFFSGISGLRVVLDLPRLNYIQDSRICNKAAVVYYVEPGNNVALSGLVDQIGVQGDAGTRRIPLDSTEQLCRVEKSPVENGKLVVLEVLDDAKSQQITDDFVYMKTGAEVVAVVLPDNGYRVSRILMDDKTVNEGTVRIEGSTVFSAQCVEEERELYNEKSCGLLGSGGVSTMKWSVYADGTLEFIGVGDIPAQSWADDYKWYSYRTKVKKIVVNDGITSIPTYAFYQTNAERIEIGNGVKTIGNSVFSSSTLLKEVSFGTGLTSIGDSAFAGCTSLHKMDFYGDQPTVGKSFCPNNAQGMFLIVYHKANSGWGDVLKDATGNSYLAVYAEEDLRDYTDLSVWEDGTLRNNQGVIFTLSGSTARVGSSKTAQKNNSGYFGINGKDAKSGYVVIPDSVNYDGQDYNVVAIQANAFSGNYFVEAVELGKNVRDVAVGAFYDCPNFSDFYLDNENQAFYVLDGILYNHNLSTLCVVPAAKKFTSYEIPSVVSTIREGAFQGCWGIQEVEIYSGVTNINDNAFLNATGLRRFYAEDTVQYIGTKAFSGCTGLEEVYIYSGVESIGNYPFYNCNAMQSMTLPFIGTSKSTGLTIYNLFGASEYSSATASHALTYVAVSGGVLAESTFSGYKSLQSVRLGSDITSIPASCFSGCTALTDLRIGNTSTGGGGYVRIPAYITSIGGSAFKSCPVTRFYVESGNNKYASDFWGALYGAVNTGNANNINKYETLICYPPMAEHWYYCVKSAAASVQNNAFLNCYNLLTVNIPSLKTTISKSAYGTNYKPDFWVHNKSKALDGLGITNVSVFESGNENQAMGILNMPDRLTFEADGTMPEFQNLFFYVTITGATILLDDADYELSCEDLGPGAHTATATFKLEDEDGNILKKSFNFHLLERDESRSIVEYRLKSNLAVKKPDKLTGYASLYSYEGQALDISDVVYIDNTSPDNDLRCAAYVPTDLLGGEARRLSVFTLKNGTTPHTEASLDLWLSAPDELKWGEGYRTGANSVPRDRAGEISWKTNEPYFNDYYRLDVCQKGENEDRVVWSSDRYGSSFRSDGDYREFQQFPLSIYDTCGEDGATYYFKVTALPNVGGNELLSRSGDLAYEQTRCYNSVTVVSEDFEYVKPETELAPPVSTDEEPMDWIVEDGVPVGLSWNEPEGETAGGYTVRIYFCRWVKSSGWAKSKPRLIAEQTFFKDAGEFNDKAVRAFVEYSIRTLNKDKAGFYAYTITTETPNVKEAVRSGESNISAHRYYVGG